MQLNHGILQLPTNDSTPSLPPSLGSRYPISTRLCTHNHHLDPSPPAPLKHPQPPPRPTGVFHFTNKRRRQSNSRKTTFKLSTRAKTLGRAHQLGGERSGCSASYEWPQQRNTDFWASMWKYYSKLCSHRFRDKKTSDPPRYPSSKYCPTLLHCRYHWLWFCAFFLPTPHHAATLTFSVCTHNQRSMPNCFMGSIF